MVNLVLDLALIIGLATVFAIIARVVKQPLIIAYLVAGLLVGPLFFNLLNSTALFEGFAHIGLALLLFIAGLHLDFRALKSFWKVSFVAGVGQVLLTSSIGFFIARYFGYSNIVSLYIAGALAFSSTVVISLLSKNSLDSETIQGRISTGILIFQDLMVAVVLMLLPLIGKGTGFSAMDVFIQLSEGLLLIMAFFLFAYFALPSLLRVVSKNQEILLLFSMSWALFAASIFDYFNFSLEVGALIAGMTLASSKFSFEIGSKIKPLRDFFVVTFFVFFGSLVSSFNYDMGIKLVVFSAFVLIGNPLIIMFFMRLFGFKKRTNFLTGVTMAQVSEFSLILAFVGFSLGVLPAEVLSLIILIGLVTMALSSYAIYYSNFIFSKLSPLLGIFDGKKRQLGNSSKSKQYDVILFGYNRLGYNILKSLKESKKKYLVVDYDPVTVSKLSKKRSNCLYGDANDLDLLSDMKLNKAKVVISTIPELETNELILRSINNPEVVFIPTSHRIADTKKLYDSGANYVIMPHFLGGEYISHMLSTSDLKKNRIDKEGQKHRKDIFERFHLGHDHPNKDSYGK